METTRGGAPPPHPSPPLLPHVYTCTGSRASNSGAARSSCSSMPRAVRVVCVSVSNLWVRANGGAAAVGGRTRVARPRTRRRAVKGEGG